MCEFLHVTPRQLGEIRHQDPAGISFLEQYMIHESKEREKAYRDAERKSKSRKGGRKH